MTNPIETEIKSYVVELDEYAISHRKAGAYSAASTYVEVATRLRAMLERYHEPSPSRRPDHSEDPNEGWHGG